MRPLLLPNLALLGLASLVITACSPGVSKSEQEERQNLAFDVSGRYVEDAQSGTPAVLTITNEQGFYDIVATLELRGGFTKADQDTLTQQVRRDDPSLSDADVATVVGRFEATMTSIVLGQGPTFTERGGENVCLDHSGDTAEIALRRTVDSVATTAHGHYTLTASLYMTGYKGSPKLDYETTANTDDEGHGANGAKGLLLSITHTQEAAGGDETTSDVTTELQLRLGEFAKL